MLKAILTLRGWVCGKAMYFDFYHKLRELESLEHLNIPSLAEVFGVPQNCFTVTDGPILAHRRYQEQPIGYLLRGTFFFPKGKVIVRGYPKITYGSLYEGHKPFAKVAERMLLSCLKEDKIFFEEKIDGINIRMYKYLDNFYFATRMTWDGTNKKGELQWGQMAKDIVDHKYPGAYKLVEVGYLPVFEMASPRFTHLSLKAKEDDLYLIDVLREHKFVTREQKERLAAKYGLKVPKIVSVIEGSISPERFQKELRALEHYAQQLGLEGVVAKGFKGDSDQAFLKIKVADVRAEHWGATIPKRFILEAIHKVQAERGEAEFLDKEKALELILEELADDFVIPSTEKVERYYEAVRAEVIEKMRCHEQAKRILSQGFRSRKDLALYLEEMKADAKVRGCCFELCELD